MTLLQALRIFGPISAWDLAKRLGRSLPDVTKSLAHLTACGFSEAVDQGHDVTQRGRMWLQGQRLSPVYDRDGAKELEMVRR